MKRTILCLAIIGFVQHMAVAQIYTNVADGITLTLSQDISVTNVLNGGGVATGISYADGLGSGALAGSGNYSIYNVATNSNLGGDPTVYGIFADSLVVSQYTGTITVVNDKSPYVDLSTGNASATANGIFANLSSDFSRNLSSTATGGSAISSNLSASANAIANGISGTLSGNVSGIIDSSAIGGSATSSNGTASANAIVNGINGSLNGNLSGTNNVTAIAGSAISSNGLASASATAKGINGNLSGNLSGIIVSSAIGGSSFPSNVTATAHGISGDLSGDLSGNIISTAIGGSAATLTASNDNVSATATANGIFGNLTGNLSGNIISTANGGSATSSNGGAYVSATAYAQAYGIRGSMAGNLTGTVNATAIGGGVNANATNTYVNVSAEAYGIESGFTGNLSGAIVSTAVGGSATLSEGLANFSASAFGISGNFSGNLTGTINAIATGGSATTSNSTASAAASAFGLSGNSIQINNFSGNISASAIAGLDIDNGVTNAGSAIAYGINAMDSLLLNAPTGSISATIEAPAGYTLPMDSIARAISGGSGNDRVQLGDVTIEGGIDLRSGLNDLVIFGKPTVQGDVSATGGQNIYTFNLYDAGSSLNPNLSVNGSVIATNGDSIIANVAASQTSYDIIGNSYEVITATNITGTFAANAQSLFFLDIVAGTTNVIITPTGVRPQTGENTPSGSSVAKATVASATAVIADLSRHTGSIRSILRSGVSPQGVWGPDEAEENQIKSGEWVAFVRQINTLGEQDSDGNIAGYDWNAFGFMVGADKLLKDGFLVGMAAGGTWSTIDSKLDAGDGDSEVFMGNLYGNWFTDTWYAELGLTYAHAWNDTERVTVSGLHTGSFESDLFGGWLEGGYILSKGDNQIESYVRTAYLQSEHDGYTDKGNSAPLTVDSSTTENWLAELGIRGKREIITKTDDYIGLTFKAGWRTELMDNTVDANGRLIEASISADSPESDSDALVLGAKVDWYVSNALTLGLEYEPVISGNWFYHNISGELSYRF